MSRRFELIIWDWDGTLADSTSMITDAICHAAHEVGLTVPSRQAASHIIGLSLSAAIERLFGQIDAETAQAVAARYRHHYYLNEQSIPLFEGVVDVIQHLHACGTQLAVATGKGRRGLSLALERSGLGAFFHTTRTVDECFSKPHPQMIEQILDELMVLPENAVMIGDTGYDLQMAQNAGVASVAVSYGAQPREVLCEYQPIEIFDDFKPLSEWILRHAG